MRDFIHGMGTMFTIFTVLGFCVFLWYCNIPNETGYSPEMTARMDDLIANLTPLSVADLE